MYFYQSAPGWWHFLVWIFSVQGLLLCLGSICHSTKQQGTTRYKEPQVFSLVEINSKRNIFFPRLIRGKYSIGGLFQGERKVARVVSVVGGTDNHRFMTENLNVWCRGSFIQPSGRDTIYWIDVQVQYKSVPCGGVVEIIYGHRNAIHCPLINSPRVHDVPDD